MMHNRRGELEHSRRDPRERDSSPAGMSRKRPSMLSEFQGKHVYSDRDRSRVYATDNTYTSSRSHDYYHGGSHRSKAHMTSSQGGGGGKYGGPSGSYHRPNYNDPRHHSYRHFTSRPNNDVSFSSDLEPQHFNKRAKLHDSLRQDKLVDSTGKSFMNSSSNASTPSGGSSSNSVAGALLTAEPVSPQYGGGLSQYISDIESDDDVDVVAQMDKQQQQQNPIQPEQTLQQQPVLPPQPLMPPQQPVEEKPIKKLMDDEVIEKKEQPAPPVACKMTKEELLLLMERVDHDIAKVELQVNVLKKKEAELADAEIQLSTALPPATPPAESHDAEKDKVVPPAETLCTSPFSCSTPSPVQPSMVETILSENQRRVKDAAESLLTSLSCAAWMTKRLQQPLYWQPCEAPGYHERIERHKRLRPQLVQVVRKRKVDLHKKEVKLCEHYDTLLSEWEKKVEKAEGNAKRKAKDVRNKEFFEKHFPEIKRHTLRLGPKGFSVVRSEAELNEILDELYEQEEALDRYQRAHAPIPPMILTPNSDHKFLNTNGLIRDPLLAHKEQRMSTTWTDEEKQTFCEKFALYPKCFEKIAQFIPNKTTSDCIQFYYLSKKKENYKELVSKVKDQKRKAAILARQQLAAESASPSSSGSYTSGHLYKLADEGKSKSKPRLLNETQTPSYTGWTADEIQRLREGLRLYGRAWGKIYRMVGPVKTATQCKSFFDDYRDDPYLQLHKALAEHNIIKNAQKAKRKAEARKQSVTSMYEAEKKRRKQKEVIIQESSDDATDDIESDRDSVIESSIVSEEKTLSETTTEAEMLSSHTDSESSTEEADEVIDHQASHLMQRTRPSRLPPVRTSEDNIDLLFSAAEALASVDSSNGIVGISTKVALHDHTYSKPTGSLTADFQGTSGLSLIAAAAAVVSPTMSSSPTGKSPLLSPVKAPRGRPPSSTKRNSAVSTKLGPTFLSPAGPSMHISLTDTKSYRGRGRGSNIAPLTKTIPHANKSSGITTKLTIPANRVGKTSVMSPTASASKFPPFSTGSNKSSSVPHPITQQGSTLAAFEALVNVAAAAKPAELPPKSLNHSSSISSSQSSKKDNFNITDVASVISSTGTISSHPNSSGISIPNLRLPQHVVSPKQTTLVMSTTNKPVRSLPLSSQKQCTTTIASHSPLESSRNIYISGTKPVSGKSDLPLRTLTVYAPMLAAQQNQSPTASPSSNNLVVKKSTAMTSGLQHTATVTMTTRLTCDVTTAPIESRVATSSSLTMVKSVAKPSVLVKPASKPDALMKVVDPAVLTSDNRKDQVVSHAVSTASEASKISVNKPIAVDSSPDVEADEERELPLRITLGQGNNSSSLVPISISRPPEGEVKMSQPKTLGDDLSSKLYTPLTKAAKKGQKNIKVDRDKPKAKKTRTSDEFESKKEQVDLSIATSVDGPASSDFLSALIPNLVNSSAPANFTTGMFLNSLTSTTGALPSRSNITHIIDRSHSNSPATDLMNSATVETEDHLVSAAHDISELSKLLEPVTSSEQSNLDQCKTLDVASAPGDFCPDATALSLFSYIPDGNSSNSTSEQQNSTTLLSASTVTTG